MKKRKNLSLMLYVYLNVVKLHEKRHFWSSAQKKGLVIKMNYFSHFKLNVKAMFKCFVLVFFHLAHAILPIKLTEHKRWGIK